jgi:hypothetical protein
MAATLCPEQPYRSVSLRHRPVSCGREQVRDQRPALPGNRHQALVPQSHWSPFRHRSGCSTLVPPVPPQGEWVRHQVARHSAAQRAARFAGHHRTLERTTRPPRQDLAGRPRANPRSRPPPPGPGRRHLHQNPRSPYPTRLPHSEGSSRCPWQGRWKARADCPGRCHQQSIGLRPLGGHRPLGRRLPVARPLPHHPRQVRWAPSRSTKKHPSRAAGRMSTRSPGPEHDLVPLPRGLQAVVNLGPLRSRCAEESCARLVTRRPAPGLVSCPYATGPRPGDQLPRLGRLEIRLGPAWVRYRETATPETDPPSTSHRPVVPGRPRARPSRLRVTLPRCRPSLWYPPAAMPTVPTSPARVRLRLPGFRSVAGAGVLARPGACSGIHPSALLEPAVLHRVAG